MKSLFYSLLLIPGFLQAQRWHINLSGGISNYSGDLQAKNYTFDQSYFAYGAGVQYDITRNFSVISNINILKVGASDQYNNPDLVFRNLSFQNNITEWNLLAEYTFLDITKKKFSPFVFAGIAIFHNNPFAYDTTGAKVYLKPLSTEGEGLSQYPGQKPYSQTQFSIPVGGGIKFRVSESVVLAYEIGFRKTFTDYIDDVSSFYVDQTILQNAKGPLAVEMAYRANELKGGDQTYPASGTKRGNPNHNDFYYYTGIRVSIALINYKTYDRGRTDCPPAVQ
jgi:opacity protein-like surface antigen